MTLLRQISDGIETAIRRVEAAHRSATILSQYQLSQAWSELNELRILVNDAAEREEEEACKD